MVFASLIGYFWEMFKLWIQTIFVAPFKTIDMLWILVPIWFAWFFAEFFQEKLGTSMGNAITNATVIVWGSIDCTRKTVELIIAGALTSWFDTTLRFLLIIAILIYGVVIIVMGLKGIKIIKYIGRIREVTYVFAVFVPVFYGVIPFSFQHLLGVILFFPLFYFVIEIFDRYTPNPQAIIDDVEEGKEAGSTGGLGPIKSPAPFNEPGLGELPKNFPKL